eukprot:TRINITY_DN2381_c0_g3_i1.p1 TRINITY_DN2381_c0_g3~~TRINITY_DN2381_c0_g3_i1.p1  ORF type:complete len:295 (+),score=55.72 TRINITY_DN2381_c0_g3_i1:55-939(+)
MLFLLRAAFLAILYVGAMAATEADLARFGGELDSYVLDLEDRNFYTYVNAQKASGLPFLVKFYAPWCKHCQDLEPIYEQVGRNLFQEALVARVDCTNNKKTCQTFDIQEYPTVMLFDGDELFVYKGSRTVDSIVQYVTNKQRDGKRSIPKEGSKPPPKQSTSPKLAIELWIKSVVEPVLALFGRYKAAASVGMVVIVFLFGFISGRLSSPSGDEIIADLMAREPSVRRYIEEAHARKVAKDQSACCEHEASEDADHLTEDQHEEREEELIQKGLDAPSLKKRNQVLTKKKKCDK